MTENKVNDDIGIVDAHHHLWVKPGWRFLLDDYLAQVQDGPGIESSVYIEGGSLHHSPLEGGTMYRTGGPEELAPLGELDFATGVAAMGASGSFGPAQVAEGIVGFADLRLGRNLEPVLDQYAAYDRLRGLRYIVGWNDDPALRSPVMKLEPDVLLREDFREGLSLLADRGLSFETSLLNNQLGQLCDVARLIPRLRIAVCHLGGPYGIGPFEARPRAAFDAWRENLAPLADCPNVHVKISGLAQGHTGLRPAADATAEEVADVWSPYIMAAIGMFGAGRCMFASNAPVDTAHVSWAVLWGAFKQVTGGLPIAERRQLFAGTARAFYRLPQAADPA